MGKTFMARGVLESHYVWYEVATEIATFFVFL